MASARDSSCGTAGLSDVALARAARCAYPGPLDPAPPGVGVNEVANVVQSGCQDRVDVGAARHMDHAALGAPAKRVESVERRAKHAQRVSHGDLVAAESDGRLSMKVGKVQRVPIDCEIDARDFRQPAECLLRARSVESDVINDPIQTRVALDRRQRQLGRRLRRPRRHKPNGGGDEQHK
jgi:hypothetical protein